MTDLSLAAQAIDDATCYNMPTKMLAAAALRTVADQLWMDKPFGDTDADAGVFSAHHAIRSRLLAIADELEKGC